MFPLSLHIEKVSVTGVTPGVCFYLPFTLQKKHFFISDYGNYLALFDAQSNFIRFFKGHEGGIISCVTYQTKDNDVRIVSMDGTSKIIEWDIDGTPLRIMANTSVIDPERGVQLTRKKCYAVHLDKNKDPIIFTWDQTGLVEECFPTHAGFDFQAAIQLPVTNRITCCSPYLEGNKSRMVLADALSISIYDLDVMAVNRELIGKFEHDHPGDTINCVVFRNEDNQLRLLTTSREDNIIQLWSVERSAIKKILIKKQQIDLPPYGDRGYSTCMPVVGYDGNKIIIITGHAGGIIYKWNSSLELIGPPLRVTLVATPIVSCAIYSMGPTTRILALGSDGSQSYLTQWSIADDDSSSASSVNAPSSDPDIIYNRIEGPAVLLERPEPMDDAEFYQIQSEIMCIAAYVRGKELFIITGDRTKLLCWWDGQGNLLLRKKLGQIPIGLEIQDGQLLVLLQSGAVIRIGFNKNILGSIIRYPRIGPGPKNPLSRLAQNRVDDYL